MAKKKKKNIFEKALDSVSNAFKPNKSSSSSKKSTTSKNGVASNSAFAKAQTSNTTKNKTPKVSQAAVDKAKKANEPKKTSTPVAVQSYTRASERGTPTYNNTPAKKKVENKGIQTRRTTNVDSRTKTNTSKQTQDQHFMTRRNTNVDSRTGKNTARHGEWTPNEKGKATNVEVGAKNVQQAMAVLEQNKDYLKSTGQYDAMRNTIMHAAMRNTAGDAGLQMIRHSGFTEKEQKKLKANHDLKAFEAAPGSTAADKKLSVALTNAAKTVASGVEGATSGVFNAVTTVADSLERHIEGDKDKQQSQIDRLVSGKLTKTEEEMGLGKYKGNRKAAEQYVKNQDKKNKQNTKTATQMADKYLEKAAADMQTAKDEADTKVGSFLTDVAIQGAKMGTETLLGGGAVGRMPVMAAEVFGQGVKEARDGGGTEAQQLAYGLTSAAIEYLSEQVFGVAGKVFGKGYADDIVENLAGRITSKFGRNATRYVLGAIGEGLEEGFSDIATPFAQMIYNGKSKKETKKDLLSKESLTNMLYDMALGTAMGAFGATTQAFNGNFAAQDQELMNEIQSHRITDAKGNKIDRLEFAAQKMEQAQKKGQPISANQIEKEWRKAYFAELTKNKGEIKKRMKNGLTRDEALAEMDEGVKWSDSEAYVSKWANRLTTNGVKTKEAVNADRVISRLIDAKGDRKAVSDAELRKVLSDLNITWYATGKPRSNSGENSLAALRDRLGLDKVTVAGESWEQGPMQENREYAADQSHLIEAMRIGARAVGESKDQIVEDAAADVERANAEAQEQQKAIDDIKKRKIIVGDLGEQTFDQFSEQLKRVNPEVTDEQVLLAWGQALETNGVPEENEAREAGQTDMFNQMADESVRRRTLGLEPEEGRAAELKQSIKAIEDELDRYDNTESPEGVYVNKETGEEVPEETIERLKQNREQLRTELMDIEPDDNAVRERVFGIKKEEPKNQLQEIHEKAEIQKNAVLTDNEVAQRLERGTRDDLNTLAGNIGYRIELSDHLVPEDADMSLDVGVNGWIDKKNRVIKLALDATDDIETLRSRVLKVVAIHETTHGLETLAPEEYKAYSDYVENNWDTLNDGEDYATALENKLKQYRDAGRDIDENGARQELMAEFASHMDQDAIFNFVNSNPTVGQKIVQMFRDIVARLREAFGHAGDMETALRKWEKAYQAAVKGTANVNNKTRVEEAYRAGIEVQDDNGEPVAIMSEDGQAQFSMRTYKEEGRDTLSTWLNKAVARKHLSRKDADDLLAEMDRIYEVCEELANSPEYVPFTRWSQATVKRGKDNEPLLHVITPNGEYSLNLDVALVCKKRQTLDKVFDRLIKKGVFDNFDMGQEDIANINQIIVRHNFETACAICFVESKRFRQAKLAEDFAEQYNTFLRGMMPEGTEATYFNFGGDPNLDNHNASVTNDVSQLDKSELNLDTEYEVEVPDPKNNKKKIPAKMTLQQLAEEKTSDNKLATRVDNKIARYLLNNAEGRHLLNRTDFIASSGFENVKALSPEVLGLYNSKKGSGGPKSAFGFAQYMHEMLDKRAFNPKAAYAVGGVRIQSFSDFVPRMFFDYAEIVGDLAAKKLPAHAYTKEEAFVKLFGLTGIKINMSLVPASKEGGLAPGLDKDGNYLWEKGQTFDYDKAVEIQQAEGYGDNCGTIAVGVSDMHIRKMLKDKNIRMIIPYHKSSLNPIIAAMNGISDFTDYTDYQNTRYADGTKLNKEDAKKEVNFNVLMHSKHMDPQQAAEAYVRWCEENNYLPRFDQFTYAQDENGEYIVEDGKLKVDENYYKLLEDFTLYNEPSDPNAQRGDYVPQREVKLRLPTDDDAFGSWKSLLTEDQYDENGNRTYQGAFNADAELDAKQEREIDAVVEDIEKNLNTPAVRERISQEQLAERQAHGDELRAAERQRYEEGLAKRRAAVQPKRESTVQYSLWKRVDPNQKQYERWDPNAPAPVETIQPSSGSWKSGPSFAEVLEQYPELFTEVPESEGEENKKGNLTQTTSTKATYNKIFDRLDEEGFNGTILDASSGRGLGTEEGKARKARKDSSFTIEDVEPFPPSAVFHKPDYKNYNTLNKTYDFIISNAVLNVEPQDQRDATIVRMGELLNDGGRMYINVRGIKDVEGSTTKQPVDPANHEWYIPNTRSYQKGFTVQELKAYVEDALGDDYTVETAMNGFPKPSNAITVMVYKGNSAPQYSLSFNKNIEDIDTSKPLKTKQGSTIKRAQNNVGKEIGGQIYVHKNYASDTKIPADVLARGEELVPDDFEYNSVMWDKSKPNEIRFDEAPDFDTATEPQVGHFLKINTETGNITAGYSPNIWHHKWLWVKDDYEGFDTREAYDRSQTWLSQVNGTAKGTIKSWNKQLEESGMEPIDSEPVPKDQAFIDRFNSQPKGIFPTKEEADRMNGKAEKPKSNVQFSISPTGKVEGFYSELQNTINNSKQKKMKPSQWLQYAKGHGQIKQEEIDYSGILSLPDESITKEDLLDYLRANQIELEEETLTSLDNNPEEYTYVDSTTGEILSFSDVEDIIENDEIPYYIIDRYKLRGRDAVNVDYRLDFGDYKYDGSASLKVVAEFSDHGYPREVTVRRFEIPETDETLMDRAFDYSHWDQYTTPGGSNYREILLKIPGSEYTNSAMAYHWDEFYETEGRTGIIAHARVDDFTNGNGDKVLFVEEIQSDWHNQGQKKGYYDETENKAEVNVFNDNLPAPDAPFKDSYVSLTLKRLLSEAVEKGYDRLAWTTAQMQSDRWLEKYAEGYRIEYDQEIPKFLNKYVKKWGSKVENMEMLGKNVGTEEIPVQRAYEVPSIPITDAMRESISTKGQPQFSLSSPRNANSVLGQNNTVPTEEEIKSGSATYGGLPIVYHPEMKADARNMDTEVWVSDKFFNDPDQQHILNHEVAHNLSDELMSLHTDDWQEFASNFIEEKQTPPSSSAYANGNRTYWEGLYGDIGATALSETTTRAITEYLDDPERLRQRSEDAYDVIDNFMRNREDNTQFSLSTENNSQADEQYRLLFASLGLDLDSKPLKSKPRQSKVTTNTFARTEVFDEAMEFIKDEDKKLAAKNAGRRLKENSEYDPIGTQEAMQAAREALIDDYKGEKKRLLSNDAWGSKDLHEAMSVACTELANGNVKEFYKMGMKIKDMGTQGGQLIQAFKIYSKTPEGAAIQVLSNVEETLGTIPPDVEESVQDLAQELRAIKDGDMDSLIEIIKRQAEIRQTPIGQHTIDQLYKETFEANYDRVYAQLMGIEEDARARNPGANSHTFWQKVSTWQLVSHLLNLRTGLRNVTSNIVFGGAETIANDLAMLPDNIISAVMGTGKRTVGFESLSMDAIRAGRDRARGTAIDVKLDIDTERNRNKYGGTRRTWKMAGGPLAKPMSMAEMVLGYELNVTDEFSKGMHDYRVRRGLEKYVENGLLTQEEADMFAEKEMLYRTFQDDTYPGVILRGIHNGLNWIGFGHTGKYLMNNHFEIKQFGVGDLVQKYTQVPGALLTRLVEYSPAGAAKMIYNLGALHTAQKNLQKEMSRASGERAKRLQEINNDIVTYQREAALSFGRAATGSLLIGLFYALAHSGILHDEGSEEDDTPAGKNAAAIRALQGLSGTQLNWSALGRWLDKRGDADLSWQNGDKLINIDFLEPLNGLMSIAAVIAQDEYIVDDDHVGAGEKALLAGQDMIHSIVNSFSEVPTMQSIKSIQNAVTYHQSDSKYNVEFEVILELAKGSITGFVPAPLRQAAQFQDDYYRDIYSTRDPIQQIGDALKNSVPGLRQTLPEKLTPYGSPKEMEDRRTRALNAFVNPGKATTFKESELEHTIAELGDNRLYPERNAPNKLGFGNKQSLTPDEKRMYQKTLGKTYTKEMNAIINTDAFKNASKGEQRDMLNEVKTFADQYAKTKIAEELKTTYGESDSVAKILEARNKGIDLSKWLGYKSTVSGLTAQDENGNSVQGLKKERTVATIAGMDISDEAKDYLYIELQKSNGVKEANLRNGLDKTPWHGGSGKFTK